MNYRFTSYNMVSRKKEKTKDLRSRMTLTQKWRRVPLGADLGGFLALRWSSVATGRSVALLLWEYSLAGVSMSMFVDPSSLFAVLGRDFIDPVAFMAPVDFIDDPVASFDGLTIWDVVLRYDSYGTMYFEWHCLTWVDAAIASSLLNPSAIVTSTHNFISETFQISKSPHAHEKSIHSSSGWKTS